MQQNKDTDRSHPLYNGAAYRAPMVCPVPYEPAPAGTAPPSRPSRHLTSDYEYCAGVLPFVRFNNSVYFLLGKSRRNNRLCTFTGKNDEFDMNIQHTASRECFEETLGCLMDQGALYARVLKCDDASTLRSSTPRRKPCYTYVIEIPYKKTYLLCFQRTRDFVATLHVPKYAFQEMVEIKWVCARTMFTRIKRQWQTSGIMRDEREWSKLAALVAYDSLEKLSWRSAGVIGECDAGGSSGLEDDDGQDD